MFPWFSYVRITLSNAICSCHHLIELLSRVGSCIDQVFNPLEDQHQTGGGESYEVGPTSSPFCTGPCVYHSCYPYKLSAGDAEAKDRFWPFTSNIAESKVWLGALITACTEMVQPSFVDNQEAKVHRTLHLTRLVTDLQERGDWSPLGLIWVQDWVTCVFCKYQHDSWHCCATNSSLQFPDRMGCAAWPHEMSIPSACFENASNIGPYAGAGNCLSELPGI